jgi:hypothetical protein
MPGPKIHHYGEQDLPGLIDSSPVGCRPEALAASAAVTHEPSMQGSAARRRGPGYSQMLIGLQVPVGHSA